MNIGFYGHSVCSSISHPQSWVNTLTKKLKANIVNKGTLQGSVERILFELKKTKKLDLAIIFYGGPRYTFLPDLERDFEFEAQKRADYLWDSPYHKDYIKEWENNSDIINKHFKKFTEKFKTVDNFKYIMNTYKQYFYEPDLALNRFYGAMIQIDQYLINKKLPCIHIIYKNNIPPFYEIKSGEVYDDIIQSTTTYFQGMGAPNGLSIEGNLYFESYFENKIKHLLNINGASGILDITSDCLSEEGGSIPPAPPKIL